MPGDFASLNGLPLVRLHMSIPAEGFWHLDATLAQAIDLTGPQVLQLSGSTWNCALVRAIDFAGIRELRLVGGTGGWRKTVPAQQYASPAGVPTGVVCSDAAGLVGEAPPVVAPPAPATQGTAFTRLRGAASLVLAQALGFWWLDPLGIVQTAQRVPMPIATPFAAMEVRGAPGWYRVMTEFPGDWQPGNVFASPTVQGTISSVIHRIERGDFWTEVLIV